MKYLLVILGSLLLGNSLVLNDLDCLGKSEKANWGLKLFLELDQTSYRELREELGLDSSLVGELRNVDDSQICEKLTYLTQQQNDWDVDFEKREKYYYRTDSFFFVIYISKQVGSSYTPLAVFDKDYKLLNQFGI